jgi:hypothetical protein
MNRPVWQVSAGATSRSYADVFLKQFDRVDRAEIQSKVRSAEDAAKDEVWGSYRFAVIFDREETGGLRTST